ncbi:hypothetical protein PR202_gb04481 [Eleusine coracana subsp. coracana]|uniref:Uncharacterized protein n=1 Tax=Eleusine coracana subsp. coracana TaxID=191504 RepID=A0AAV5E3V8_ELECO|nr:hypothetical protein PR202_gb04481 [Eleusine coracana subsp. coracana]
MALALASPMASLSLHSGRISAAAIGGLARPCRAIPSGASASPFLRSSFVSSSSTSSASASPASLSAAVSASLAFTSSSSFGGENRLFIFGNSVQLQQINNSKEDEDYFRKEGPEA